MVEEVELEGVCRGRNKYTVLAKSPSLGGLTWLQCQPHTRQVASQACSGPCRRSSTVQIRRPNAYFAARERAGYCCCCWRHRGRLNPAWAFSYFTCSLVFVWFPRPFLPVHRANLAICNPRRPLTPRKSGFRLERGQPEQPNLHLQKPGSRVSLLPARRGRTRRGPKPRPCGGAAGLLVSFHDKHFHRWSRTLFICSSDSPAAVFVGGHSGGREIIFTANELHVWSFRRFRRHPSPFHSNQPKTAPNSLRLSFPADLSPPRVPTRSNIPPDPSLFLMAGPCCVLSSEGPSLSPLPLAFVAQTCYQPLTSPANLQNCAPTLFLEQKSPTRLQRSLYQEAMAKTPAFREKKTWPRRDNPSKCIHVCCRWEKKQPPLSDSVFIAYIRPVNVCPHTNTRLQRYPSKIRSG